MTIANLKTPKTTVNQCIKLQICDFKSSEYGPYSLKINFLTGHQGRR